MSGLVKGIKKVFKKVAKFVKKYWKVIVIAVAVYFTAGVALSYFGGTAAFASSLPGFGAGGIFSKAAVWMGFNGSASVASGLSLTSGAFTAGLPSAGYSALSKAGLKAMYGKTAAEASAILEPITAVGTKVAAGGTVSGAQAASAGKVAALTNAAGPAATTTVSGGASAADAATKALSGAMKMQAASTLLQTAGGLFAPSEEELMEKQHSLQWGQAFGVDRSGNRQYGWSTGQAPAPGPNQASPYAQQPAYTSPQGGGSMYAAQGGGQEFLSAPQQTGPTSMPQAPQGDFIVQPQPAGGQNG